MSLLAIPPELHIPIFSFLDIEDLARLVQTCQYFHRTASHHMRRRVDDETLRVLQRCDLENPPKTDPIARTAFIQDDYFDFRRAFGLDFTAIDRETEERTRRSIQDFGLLLDLVRIGIKSSAPSIVDGALYISKHVVKRTTIFSQVFNALRKFSYTRPASEFSITSLTAQLTAERAIQLFDTRKLTKLSISNKQVGWNTDGTTQPSEETLRDVAGMKELFRQSPNLETLVINPVMEISEFNTLPEPLPPVFDELTEHFLALKKLHTLDLRVYLFHPSYFLPVPEGVRTLSFYHVNLNSKAWWEKFAKFPFKNVEHLEIYPSEAEFVYIYTRDDYSVELDRDNTPRTPEEIKMKGFNIGDVEIRGLKTFKFEDTSRLFLPRDLTASILERNQNLNEDVRQALMQKLREKELENAIASFGAPAPSRDAPSQEA